MNSLLNIISALLFFITPIIMVIGLIWPQVIEKWFSWKLSRKQILLKFSLATFGFLILGAFTAPPAPPKPQAIQYSATPTPEISTPTPANNPEVLGSETVIATTPPISDPTPTPTPSSTPTPTPVPTSMSTPTPTPIPTYIPKQVVTQPTTTQPAINGYTCNCAKTCPNMSCAEAQFQLNTCGCSRRDADNDGVACDSQCQ